MAIVKYKDPILGLEAIILNDGSAWVTQSSYAQFADIAKQTISSRCEKYQTIDCIDLNEYIVSPKNRTNEILIRCYIEAVDGRNRKALLVPAEIFGLWIVKDKPELAIKILKAGATVFLYDMAGYKLTAEARVEKKTIELPPPDIRMANFESAMKFFQLDMDDPRMATYYRDAVKNIFVSDSKQKSIEPQEKWYGVVERAEQLGYSVGKISEKRSQLGKFVSKNMDSEFVEGMEVIQRKREKRLCNETMREIWVYKMSESLDKLIKIFCMRNRIK